MGCIYTLFVHLVVSTSFASDSVQAHPFSPSLRAPHHDFIKNSGHLHDIASATPYSELRNPQNLPLPVATHEILLIPTPERTCGSSENGYDTRAAGKWFKVRSSAQTCALVQFCFWSKKPFPDSIQLDSTA